MPASAAPSKPASAAADVPSLILRSSREHAASIYRWNDALAALTKQVCTSYFFLAYFFLAYFFLAYFSLALAALTKQVCISYFFLAYFFLAYFSLAYFSLALDALTKQVEKRAAKGVLSRELAAASQALWAKAGYPEGMPGAEGQGAEGQGAGTPGAAMDVSDGASPDALKTNLQMPATIDNYSQWSLTRVTPVSQHR